MFLQLRCCRHMISGLSLFAIFAWPYSRLPRRHYAIWIDRLLQTLDKPSMNVVVEVKLICHVLHEVKMRAILRIPMFSSRRQQVQKAQVRVPLLDLRVIVVEENVEMIYMMLIQVKTG